MPFPFAGSGLLSLALGLAAPEILNPRMDAEERHREVVKSDGDRLEVLLDRAIDNKWQVSITMDSGKVYIGYVSAPVDPAQERRYITLIPSVSGYRDPKTHILQLTTDYTQVLLNVDHEASRFNNMTRGDFEVIIPVGSLRSINVFDQTAYQLFNEINGPDEAEAIESAPSAAPSTERRNTYGGKKKPHHAWPTWKRLIQVFRRGN
ncbi:hypothetical protein [Rubrivirga marina]|uniref:hypothetical protein n=1 Tax=Rubrivirga marina TaxID=1196024 RepID=UPI00117B3AC3|nr:hypothetical protein [Rubrivirga marina]